MPTVTTPLQKTRATMPQPTPHGRECRTCPVSLLLTISPILGTVRAGEPTIQYEPEENPLRGFRGIIKTVTVPYLTGDGVAIGDVLLISTRWQDVAQSDLYDGRVVLAIDTDGTHYVARYDRGQLCDDRGVIASESVEVVGVVRHVLRGV